MEDNIVLAYEMHQLGFRIFPPRLPVIFLYFSEITLWLGVL